jgi:hypothetical protein
VVSIRANADFALRLNVKFFAAMLIQLSGRATVDDMTPPRIAALGSRLVPRRAAGPLTKST